MNVEEFREKVEKLSSNRGTVWVSIALIYKPEDTDKIRQHLESRLKCRKCGKCCGGFWFDVAQLTMDDYRDILYSGISPSDFDEGLKMSDKYMICLKMPCIFLKDKRCLIYKSRPAVCKLFPIAIGKGLFINVSCSAGLDLYLDLVKENNLELDSEGI